MYKRSNPANPVLKPAAISADVDGDKPLDEDERRAKEDEKETNELLDCYRVADEEINKPWKGKDKLAIKNGSNKRNLYDVRAQLWSQTSRDLGVGFIIINNKENNVYIE